MALTGAGADRSDAPGGTGEWRGESEFASAPPPAVSEAEAATPSKFRSTHSPRSIYPQIRFGVGFES